MTAKLKVLFALLLSAAALMTTACSFVITSKKQPEDLLIIEKDDPIPDVDYKDGTEEQPVEQLSPDELENQPTDPVPAVDETVYEYINVVRNTKPNMEGLDFGDKFTSSFSIPQLRAESDNVKAFNEKILAIYPDIAFEKDFTDEPVPTECAYDYSYTYDVTDNAIVALGITESLGYYYSERYTSHIFLYYDLKNDCEVVVQDYLDALGIDYDTLKANAKKTLYMKTATGDGIGSYDMRFADEYIAVGEDIIPAETDGCVNIEFSSDFGYYFVEIPIDEIVYEKAYATQDAHIYATPSADSDVLGILDKDDEVSVICKASLPEYMQTIEFDESFEWYAVELGDVRGYMLEMELRF